MTLNIALNTIIIIMVFLFPGIITRKTFFSQTFKNRYEDGTLIDKIVWNILLSTINIILFSFVYNVIKYFFSIIQYHYSIFNVDSKFWQLEYKEVFCVFESLSNNELPSELIDYNVFTKYIFYLFIVYLFSYLIGKTFYKAIKLFKFERWFSTFQFSNHWEYLITPNHYNFSEIKIKKGYTTWVDVLIGEKDKSELYRGSVEKIIYDKQNKIEHILLKKTLVFKRIEFEEPDGYEEVSESDSIAVKGRQIKENTIHILSENYLVYKKVIDGDIFVIPANNIKNINFSYIPPFKTEELLDDDLIIDDTIIVEQLVLDELEPKIETNIIGGFVVVSVFSIITFLWNKFELNDYIDFTNTIISVVSQFLKGAYLIIYFVSVISFIINILKRDTTQFQKINYAHVIIFLSILLLGILYGVSFGYTVILAFSYNLLIDIFRVMLKSIKNFNIRNWVILLLCIIYTILIFKYCFKV